jgi:hypothetical protein
MTNTRRRASPQARRGEPCNPIAATVEGWNSRGDLNAAVIASIALQQGVPLEVIRKALMCACHGRTSGPLAAALDLLAGEDATP